MRQRDKLAHIAVERVRAELERIVEGPHPQRGLALLLRSGLLPRGKAPFPWTGNDLAAAAARTTGLGNLQDARLRWALLLHALGSSAAAADDLLRAWTFPGATRVSVVAVLRVREAWDAALSSVAPEAPGATEVLRRRWIAAVLAHGQSAAEGWLTLLAAAEDAAVQARLLRSWTAAMPLRSLAELAVTGHELAELLQKRPGPWLGVLLNKLLLAAAAGGIANDKQLLLQEAQRMDRDEE
jgi:tRNA nucleotidyltransferase (CCA-adding enzyme)